MKQTLNDINSGDQKIVSRRAAVRINSFSAQSSRLTEHTICSSVAFSDRETNCLGGYDCLCYVCESGVYIIIPKKE